MHLSVAQFQKLFYACQVLKLISSATSFEWQNTNLEIKYKNDGSTESVKDDFIEMGPAYRVYANIWNSEECTKESYQNVQVQSANDGGVSISWKTDYKWERVKETKKRLRARSSFKASSKRTKKQDKKRKKNTPPPLIVEEGTDDYSVKSFANVFLHLSPEYNPQLEQIQSIESTWKWELKPDLFSGELVSNVAYDFFTSDDQRCEGGKDTGCTKNEIIIWMHKTGDMKPVGDHHEKTYKFGDCEFDVYTGVHAAWQLYSLVAKNSDGCKPTDKFDVFQGISWVARNFDISTEQYLVSAYAGTQVVSGQATFESAEYSMVIKYKTY
ncbi:hypothetical protein CROQUDRAFT_130075 [Cronartium quercuum f. sp. fusiforme G11]|uniref:Uncharacterized protein n=1 Tax=Cronartium quercuum f. sp. fusiforme G11 TaxID=708437 RepID=A0A9P6NWD4_9BASI|nr:hypothetical protein CROQUDRAFT_130075 [Cronartium quercuum f. sp. fusiforme G11]